MSFDINMNQFKEYNKYDKESLGENLEKISDHIVNGKSLKHQYNRLVGLAEHISSKTSEHDLEVLEDLSCILLRANEAGLSETHKKQLDSIRELCVKIISANKIDENNPVANSAGKDVLGLILANTSVQQAGSVARVSKKWQEASQSAQINMINEHKLKLKDLFPKDSGHAIVNWIVTNPNCQNLRYVDFSGFPHFDIRCLNKLKESCPKIETLILRNCDLKNSAVESAKELINSLKDLKKIDLRDNYIEMDMILSIEEYLWMQRISSKKLYKGITLSDKFDYSSLISTSIQVQDFNMEDILRNIQKPKDLKEPEDQ